MRETFSANLLHMTDNIIWPIAAGRSLASTSRGLLCKNESFLQLRYTPLLLNELLTVLSVKWHSLTCVFLLKATMCILLFEKFAESIIPMTRILCFLGHAGHHCPTETSPSAEMTIASIILTTAGWLSDYKPHYTWKSQRKVSDYLVAQRRVVVTFMPQ